MDNPRPLLFYFREDVFRGIVLYSSLRRRLGIVVPAKGHIVWRQGNGLGWILCTINQDFPRLVTEGLKIGFRNVVVTFLIHGTTARLSD